MVDDDGSDLDEEYGSGSVEAGMCKVVTESWGKDIEEVHKAAKSTSILSYMLKPPYFLTQVFKEKNKTHDNIFKNCVNLGHSNSGGVGEDPSVPILMLIPEISIRSAQSKPFELCNRLHNGV